MENQFADSLGLCGVGAGGERRSHHRHCHCWSRYDGRYLYGIRGELSKDRNQRHLGPSGAQRRGDCVACQLQLLYAIAVIPKPKRSRQSSRAAEVVGYRHPQHSESGILEEEQSCIMVDPGFFLRPSPSRVSLHQEDHVITVPLMQSQVQLHILLRPRHKQLQRPVHFGKLYSRR